MGVVARCPRRHTTTNHPRATAQREAEARASEIQFQYFKLAQSRVFLRENLRSLIFSLRKRLLNRLEAQTSKTYAERRSLAQYTSFVRIPFSACQASACFFGQKTKSARRPREKDEVGEIGEAGARQAPAHPQEEGGCGWVKTESAAETYRQISIRSTLLGPEPKNRPLRFRPSSANVVEKVSSKVDGHATTNPHRATSTARGRNTG